MNIFLLTVAQITIGTLCPFCFCLCLCVFIVNIFLKTAGDCVAFVIRLIYWPNPLTQLAYLLKKRKKKKKKRKIIFDYLHAWNMKYSLYKIFLTHVLLLLESLALIPPNKLKRTALQSVMPYGFTPLLLSATGGWLAPPPGRFSGCWC